MKRKNSFIPAVIICLFLIGIGYAVLTTNLNINGTAGVNAPTSVYN